MSLTEQMPHKILCVRVVQLFNCFSFYFIAFLHIINWCLHVPHKQQLFIEQNVVGDKMNYVQTNIDKYCPLSSTYTMLFSFTSWSFSTYTTRHSLYLLFSFVSQSCSVYTTLFSFHLQHMQLSSRAIKPMFRIKTVPWKCSRSSERSRSSYMWSSGHPVIPRSSYMWSSGHPGHPTLGHLVIRSSQGHPT